VRADADWELVTVDQLEKGGRIPEACASLEGPDPCGFCDLDGLDAHASDGKVLIGGRDSVRHLGW